MRRAWHKVALARRPPPSLPSAPAPDPASRMPRSFLVKKHFSANKKPNYSELESQTGTRRLGKGRRRALLGGGGGGECASGARRRAKPRELTGRAWGRGASGVGPECTLGTCCLLGNPGAGGRGGVCVQGEGHRRIQIRSWSSRGRFGSPRNCSHDVVIPASTWLARASPASGVSETKPALLSIGVGDPEGMPGVATERQAVAKPTCERLLP